MGSQNSWFGDSKTLLYRFKSLYRRVQWFLGTLPIKQDTLSLDVLALFARGRGTFRCGFARRLRREKPSAQYQDLGEWLALLPIEVVHDKWSILDGSICEKHIRINRSINQKCINHPFPRLDFGDGFFRFDLKTDL